MVGRIYIEDHYTLLHTKYESSGPCGSYYVFSHDAPGVHTGPAPGAQLAGFIKRTIIHCYTQNMKALGLVVSEKKIFFLCFSHCKSMGAVAMETRVLIRPGPKPNTAFPPPQCCFR